VLVDVQVEDLHLIEGGTCKHYCSKQNKRYLSNYMEPTWHP
jgi:hypothetical protein